jgi:hypothetical protein
MTRVNLSSLWVIVTALMFNSHFMGQNVYVNFIKLRKNVKCINSEAIQKVHIEFSQNRFIDDSVYFRITPLIRSRKNSCIGIYAYESWEKIGKNNFPPSNTNSYYPILLSRDNIYIYSRTDSLNDRSYNEFMRVNRDFFNEAQMEAIKYFFMIRPPRSLHGAFDKFPELFYIMEKR